MRVGNKKAQFLLAALLAFIFSGSSFCTCDTPGITTLGLSATLDGPIFADRWHFGPTYKSDDGGLTWSRVEPYSDTWDVGWVNLASVETPRGRFTFREGNIYHREGGAERQVYSASYTDTESNHWARYSKTGSHYCELPATAAHAIMYDPVSGNVVVALADLGVAVGLPGGEWVEVQVGEFGPVDYSYFGKLERLTTHGFWLFAFSIALLLVAPVALVILHWEVRLLDFILFGIVCAFFYFIITILAFFGVFFVLDVMLNIREDRTVSAILFMSLGLLNLASLLAFKFSRENVLRIGIGIGCILAGWALMWLLLLRSIGPSGLVPLLGESIEGIFFGAGMTIYLPVLALLLCRTRNFLPSIGIAIAACYAILVVSYLLWIATIVPSIKLQLIPIALFLIILAVYLRKRTNSDDVSLTTDEGDASRPGETAP